MTRPDPYEVYRFAWSQTPLRTNDHAAAVEWAHALAKVTGRRYEVRRTRGFAGLFLARWTAREVSGPRRNCAIMAHPGGGSI